MLIDGTNLINQGDTLLAGASLNWIKVMLTYFVPYAVAYRLRHSRRSGETNNPAS